jgi:alpha-amylase/alpha-mannosidase (GH57 family)
MSRYICIHGHFYQPPRENPWLEEVETEDSAYPYHDWNARITAECYAPNAASRILDAKKRIIDIVNNYAKISFNFGPTLLSWLEENQPDVYQAILHADRESQKRFSGHGAAIAQVYNHIIMPLANIRDKRTQVIWGIRDFERRFGRKPEGMWLPETAVDLETLEVLAEQEIVFTILSPRQAQRVKKFDSNVWTDVSKGTIDTSMPYLCRLPSGKSIALFFYDDAITQEVAFSNLLENGEIFTNRMMRYFSQHQLQSGLLNIATDGETYGHHHRFGDMALAYAHYLLEEKGLVKLTIYGEYLELNPPTHLVEIMENTSWSCDHGVERWRSDCGCCTPGTILEESFSPLAHAHETLMIGMSCPIKWRQKWRAPLREAMNRLRDELAGVCEERMRRWVSDPWQARDDYIDVILDRTPASVESFLERHANSTLSSDDKVQILKFLEIQRNALLMFTSCGWFFGDIAGIESIQVLKYACRAIQLAQDVAGIDPEPQFIEILKNAPSNIPDRVNGAEIYRNFVQTSIIDLSRVGFHFALLSLFAESPDAVRIRNYTIQNGVYERSDAGALKLAIGKASLRSKTTWEETTLMFAVLHMGNHNFMGGATPFSGDREYAEMKEKLEDAFSRSDIPRLILCVEKQFRSRSYSLWHLFRDGQRKVLYHILDSTLADLESVFRQIYNQHFPLLQAMKEMQIPPPKALEDPMGYILNIDLRKVLGADEIDVKRLGVLASEMERGRFSLDTATLNFAASSAITLLMKKLRKNPEDILTMETVNAVFTTLSPLSLKYDLWECQNSYFRIGREMVQIMQKKVRAGDNEAEQWIRIFEGMGDYLGVKYL